MYSTEIIYVVLLIKMECILHAMRYRTNQTGMNRKTAEDPFCIDFHIDQGKVTPDTTSTENPFESNQFGKLFRYENI